MGHGAWGMGHGAWSMEQELEIVFIYSEEFYGNYLTSYLILPAF